MTNSASDLTLQNAILWFEGASEPLCVTVKGPIINSATKHRDELRKWKERVAYAVEAKRGDQWCSKHLYAVTVQLRFYVGQGSFRPKGQKLDVDNYVKPVLDALAAGLFLPECKFLDGRVNIETFAVHHGVDDSNFRTLLIRRLPNAEKKEEEGVRLFVSTTGLPADAEATHGSAKETPR